MVTPRDGDAPSHGVGFEVVVAGSRSSRGNHGLKGGWTKAVRLRRVDSSRVGSRGSELSADASVQVYGSLTSLPTFKTNLPACVGTYRSAGVPVLMIDYT